MIFQGWGCGRAVGVGDLVVAAANSDGANRPGFQSIAFAGDDQFFHLGGFDFVAHPVDLQLSARSLHFKFAIRVANPNVLAVGFNAGFLADGGDDDWAAHWFAGSDKGGGPGIGQRTIIAFNAPNAKLQFSRVFRGKAGCRAFGRDFPVDSAPYPPKVPGLWLPVTNSKEPSTTLMTSSNSKAASPSANSWWSARTGSTRK